MTFTMQLSTTINSSFGGRKMSTVGRPSWSLVLTLNHSSKWQVKGLKKASLLFFSKVYKCVLTKLNRKRKRMGTGSIFSALTQFLCNSKKISKLCAKQKRWRREVSVLSAKSLSQLFAKTWAIQAKSLLSLPKMVNKLFPMRESVNF